MSIKKKGILILLGLLLLTGITCANSNSPSEVVKNMNKAVLTNDTKLFVKCLTKADYEQMVNIWGADGTITFLKALFGGLSGMASSGSKEIKIVSENIQGNTATVVVEGNPIPFNLVKEDGAWKINLGLTDMMNSW